MATGQTLEKKIQYRIKRSRDSVFMLSDFTDLSDKDQIGRALRKLQKKNLIVKIGQGLYARAKISAATNKPIPEKNMKSLAVEALKKMKVKIVPSEEDIKYNKMETTQIPTGRLIAVKGRVNRKIGFNGNYIKYARVS
ncbi:MAG: DUF6088 family protein [bacterium]